MKEETKLPEIKTISRNDMNKRIAFFFKSKWFKIRFTR